MAEQLPVGRLELASRVAPAVGRPGASSNGVEPAPDLRAWLAVVWRHRLLAGGVALAAVAVAAAVAYRATPLYRATAVVRLVDARQALAGSLVGGPGLDIALRSTNPVLSQVEVLGSRATASSVVDAMPILRIQTRRFPVALLRDVRLAPGVDRDSLQLRFGERTVWVQRQTEEREVAYGSPIDIGGIGFTIPVRPASDRGTLYVIGREAATTGVTRSLAVRPREETDVINIAFTASDPERAQQVANRVAQVFQAADAEASQQEARRRRAFIETQLRFNDSLLAEVRSALNAFHAREPETMVARLDDPGSVGALEARRAELEIERRQYAGLLGRLQDTSGVVRRSALRNLIVASPNIAGNPVVFRLYEQLSEYEQQRDSLTTGDWARAATHPDVERLQPLIAASEASLVGAIQSVVASLDARIDVLRDLRGRSVATARRLSGVQASEEVLAERVEDARRESEHLRVEYQRARIAEAVQVGQVEIVDLAPLPRAPMGVGRVRIMVFGLLLGLLLGGGSAFLADHLNSSLHRREDIEHLGLPVLGIVPHAKGNSGSGAGGDAAPIFEAMRGIRFNLTHAYGTAGPVVFTLTSPGSREGKSFVASNLALAFADAGHRTLLIDADLRRGSLHRVLNTRRKPGLTDVLRGAVARDDAIHATPYPPLFFIAAGTRTPDAPELLGSEAMSTFLTAVRQSFSVIVVDAPPLGAGVDAYALGAVTGAVLMVLRVGTTNREAAEAKLDLLDRLPVRLLGAVLNDVPTNSPYFPYSYYLEGYGYEVEGAGPRTFAPQPRTD